VQEDPEATPNLVKAIISKIQTYQSNILGVSESSFFSPICKILQEATKLCEAQLQHASNGNSGTTFISKEQDVMAQVEREILAVLPDHHTWFGKPYHFHHADVEAIMQQIG
jgi:uncharacterized protein YukE